MGMYISVTALRDAPGQALPISFDVDGAGLEAAGSVAFVGPVEVRGTLQAAGEYYRAEGTVKYSKSFVCDRCLAETVLTETASFSENFSRGTALPGTKMSAARSKRARQS